MLDVHIAVSADRPEDWVTQCVASVTAAAARAGYPVHIHVIDAVPEHIGRARRNGFARGAADYVTCVDDDDYVLTDAFACLKTALAKRPAAVFTRELQLHGAKHVTHNTRHHLAVYRRDVLDGFDFEVWPACPDVALRRVGQRHPDGVLDVLERVYVNRVYPTSKARVLRRDAQDELKRAHTA